MNKLDSRVSKLERRTKPPRGISAIILKVVRAIDGRPAPMGELRGYSVIRHPEIEFTRTTNESDEALQKRAIAEAKRVSGRNKERFIAGLVELRN